MLLGERAEAQEKDEQRREDLQHQRHGQVAKALCGRRVLCGAEDQVVLLVRLQPDRDPAEGLDPGIQEAARQPELEHVHAVMSGRVRVLLRLMEPARALGRTGGSLRGRQLALARVASAQRQQEQERDDRRADAEAAVPQQAHELVASDSSHHGIHGSLTR